MSQQESDIGEVANKIFETVDNSALKTLPGRRIREYLNGTPKKVYQGALNHLLKEGHLESTIGTGDTFYQIP